MKYKLDYGLGRLTINFQIKFTDILEMSTEEYKDDNILVGERTRDIQQIINKLDIPNKELILDKEEIELIEKYIFSFKNKNEEMLKRYWGERSKSDLPYITALMFRSILRIKYEYNIEKFWENDDLIIEELNNSMNQSYNEFNIFTERKINKAIEVEKSKLADKKNNEVKNNNKIKKLSSIDMIEVKNNILLYNDSNNIEYLELTIFKLSQILFKILSKIKEISLEKQQITDKLLGDIIELYNHIPKDERYDAVYKNLVSLKQKLEDKVEDIDNYKNIYKETVKKQNELIEKGKLTKSKAHNNIVNLTNKEMNSYVELSLNKIDRDIDKLETNKFISKNKKILVNNLLNELK